MDAQNVVVGFVIASILVDWYLRSRLRGPRLSTSRAVGFGVLGVVFLLAGFWAAAVIAAVGAVGFALFARGFELPMWAWFIFAVGTFVSGLYFHDAYMLFIGATLAVALLVARAIGGSSRSRL